MKAEWSLNKALVDPHSFPFLWPEINYIFTHARLGLGLKPKMEKEIMSWNKAKPVKIQQEPVSNVEMPLALLLPEPSINIIKRVQLNGFEQQNESNRS
jgi:hypothetical protein